MATQHINDRLGPGGLSSVAVFSEDASGNVTGLVEPGGSNVILIVDSEVVAAAGTATSLANGYTAGSVATAANMTTKIVDTDGALLDLANDYVVVPAGFNRVKVSANVLFAANATGSRYVALEQYFQPIATWVPVTGFYEERAARASGATPINFSATLAVLSPSTFTRLRLAVGQDSGGALNVTLIGVTFEFFRFPAASLS